MDGPHKQHRVKEAKTHMVHKLHDSIYIKWKYRQNSVRSQNNDSAENWGFCFLFSVLHGVEYKPGEKLLICTITICSLFSLCSEKCYMKKNYKADITKGLCVCSAQGPKYCRQGFLRAGSEWRSTFRKLAKTSSWGLTICPRDRAEAGLDGREGQLRCCHRKGSAAPWGAL